MTFSVLVVAHRLKDMRSRRSTRRRVGL